MRFLKQITTLVLTLEVSFCKGVVKIDSTTEKGQTTARNGVTHKKMIFLPDLTTELEQIYAGNTTKEGKRITTADNFTLNSTNEKLKSFLRDNILDNDTYNDWLSINHLSSLEKFVMNSFEDQKETMNRLNDDLTDLQLKVDSRVTSRVPPTCKWDNNDETECLPSDCSEAFKKTGESGVHKIKPPGKNVLAFHVYCLKDDASGDPWTVIQRRFKGVVNFDRNWHQYKIGFGSLDDEFWLGLEHIHTLTNSDKYELRITLTNWDGNKYVAYYDNFVISDEGSKYALQGIGVHTGTASDSMKQYQGGQKWSTFDKDNDQSEINCAKYYRSGWWYRHCMYCNLNGEYPTEYERFKVAYKGIYWGSIQKTSFNASEMAIRIKK